MTRILVLTRVFPPEVGGSGRWLWELYSRFPAGDCLVVADESPGHARFDETHELPIVRMPLMNCALGLVHWRGAPEYLKLYRQLGQLAEDHAISETHAACVLPEGFLAWLLWRRKRQSYRVYVHGEELNIVAHSRELTCMARRVFRDAETLIANSQNTAALLREKWSIKDRQIQVLHPGVDTLVYRPAPMDPDVRRRFGWGNRPVVLTVGRLQPRKGQDNFIRALAEIRRDVPDVLYSIVGGGDDRRRLEQLIDELKLNDHVIMQGELRDDDLVAAYQQCDLFALPNRDVRGDIEGFGLVLLEAQACGKPVLTGTSGGTAETIQSPDAGVLVDCTSPQLIAQATVRLLSDPARLWAMGEAGRERMCRHFDWSVCVDQARREFGLERSSSYAVAEV